MIKGILFDVDGVIFDSEPFIRQAYTKAFADLGAVITDENFAPIVGTGEIPSISYLADISGLDVDPYAVKDAIYEYYGQIIRGKLKAFPGVLDFIRNCARAGVKMAVATSSDRVKFLKSMKETGVDIEVFDAVICGDEVPRTKPYGDIYEYAALRLCLPPEETLVIEDALKGLSAARNAHCHAMGVPTSFDERSLLLGGADFVSSFTSIPSFATVEELNGILTSRISESFFSGFIGDLVRGASKALENAYAPYSDFKVGAAVLTASGKIYTGCNVENASYGASRCAEQSAVLTAVSAEGPETEILALAVASLVDDPAPPCSICRQILNEFAYEDMQVYLYSLKTGKTGHYNFGQLLPLAFKL